MGPSRPSAKRALPVVAVLTLALQGCATETFGPSGALAGRESFDPSAAGEELRANRERWEGQGVADYRYTVRRICLCEPETAGPALVEVRDGRTASVTAVEGGPEIRAEAFDSLDNFREVFDYVQAAIDEKPDELRAEYDAERGYPVSLWVDPRRDRADDERGFVVESFEPLR